MWKVCSEWSLQTFPFLGNDSRLETTRMKREQTNYRKNLRQYKMSYEGTRNKSKEISFTIVTKKDIVEKKTGKKKKTDMKRK